MIAMDGVNSMTGNAPDVAAFAALAREHDALLYVDDAHGFGVIGERSSDELCDYGTKGNGVMRHLDAPTTTSCSSAGFSKAYSSLLAFIALPTRLKDVLKVLAPPYLYSGPSPVASLATALTGLEVNRTRGDVYRFDLWRKTHRVLDALRELDIYTPNESGYPIIEIPLANHEEIDDVGPVPVRPRHLRHDGRLPARAQERGRASGSRPRRPTPTRRSTSSSGCWRRCTTTSSSQDEHASA